jgi:hypothetical protein
MNRTYRYMILALSIIGLTVSYLIWDNCQNEVWKSSKTYHLPLSERNAARIANEYFKRDPDASCFVEDRGDHFFIAPPMKRGDDWDSNGVYVNKSTGALTRRIDVK